jgi:hypothetical protein
MYECKNCGADECGFPSVILAINPPKPIDDACEPDFELKYNQIWREHSLEPYIKGTYQVVTENIEKAWNFFHQWIGDKKSLWFCSVECAMIYMRTHQERNI